MKPWFECNLPWYIKLCFYWGLRLHALLKIDLVEGFFLCHCFIAQFSSFSKFRLEKVVAFLSFPFAGAATIGIGLKFLLKAKSIFNEIWNVKFRALFAILFHPLAISCSVRGLKELFLQKCQKISKGINFPKNYEFGHQPSKYSLLVSEEEMTVVWCYRLTIPHRRWNDFADFEVLLTSFTILQQLAILIKHFHLSTIVRFVV